MVEREIVFGTGPVRLGAEADSLRAALAAALSGAMRGTPVRIATNASYAELLARFTAGELDAAWMSPALALRAMSRARAVPLVTTLRSPGAAFYGTIFVRARSHVQAPGDLLGTRVAWVDRDSCSGYLFPRLALASAGLPPAGFFSEERFLGSHAAVARAVASGEVDAGATFFNVDDVALTGEKVSAGWGAATLEPMRPVLTTAAIPADLVVASSRLPPELRERLAAALVAAHGPGGAPMLGTLTTRLLGAFGFERPDLAKYDVVRLAMGPS